MSSKKEYPPTIKNLLKIKQEVFEKTVLSTYELYKKGRFMMFFIGPSIRATGIDEDEKVIMKKHNLSKREFHQVISGMLHCVHFNLFDEVEVVLRDLAKKDKQNFKKKISFVSKIMAKDPTIKNSFYIYSLSKIPFFAGIDWEAEIKVFHSPHEFLTKPPTLPVGCIRIHTMDTCETPSKSDAFQFEINSRDVETLINNLENLLRALQNLETAKIVPKRGS